MACMFVSTSYTEAALRCIDISNVFSWCMEYVKARAPLSPDCCEHLKALNNEAKTTEDRQQICKCIRIDYGQSLKIKNDIAAGLDGKCGVNLGTNPSTDCNKLK
ncbi:non-specific lipid-transfer protein Lac s 1-like [Rutidosis leptorrhynchoides]|uniref:non-specific lipid-transfer protein Lac s 1-like n=1 Tax=Rutidosis leptorrhynchoides TaxID=125765 RepID=UPI003A997CE0